MSNRNYIDEAIACFYSPKNCHILIGGINEISSKPLYCVLQRGFFGLWVSAIARRKIEM